MIKKYFILFYFVLFCFILFADDYTLIFVKDFSTGYAENQLGYDAYPSLPMLNPGPSAITFTSEEEVVIADTWRNRFVIFSKMYEYKREIVFNTFHPVFGTDFIFMDEDFNIAGQYNKYTISQINYSGMITFDINFQAASFYKKVVLRNFIFHNNTFIYPLKNNEILCIPNPGPDSKENLEKVLLNEDARKYINETEGLEDLVVDEQNRVFVNGKYVTKDYNHYVQYWNEQHEGMDSQHKEISDPIESFRNSFYLGEDSDGNIYWCNNWDLILVFDDEGWLLDAFQMDYEKTKVKPAIHPSGDVYFLDYDGEKNYLYKIKRVW